MADVTARQDEYKLMQLQERMKSRKADLFPDVEPEQDQEPEQGNESSESLPHQADDEVFMTPLSGFPKDVYIPDDDEAPSENHLSGLSNGRSCESPNISYNNDTVNQSPNLDTILDHYGKVETKSQSNEEMQTNNEQQDELIEGGSLTKNLATFKGSLTNIAGNITKDVQNSSVFSLFSSVLKTSTSNLSLGFIPVSTPIMGESRRGSEASLSINKETVPIEVRDGKKQLEIHEDNRNISLSLQNIIHKKESVGGYSSTGLPGARKTSHNIPSDRSRHNSFIPSNIDDKTLQSAKEIVGRGVESPETASFEDVDVTAAPFVQTKRLSIQKSKEQVVDPSLLPSAPILPLEKRLSIQTKDTPGETNEGSAAVNLQIKGVAIRQSREYGLNSAPVLPKSHSSSIHNSREGVNMGSSDNVQKLSISKRPSFQQSRERGLDSNEMRREDVIKGSLENVQSLPTSKRPSIQQIRESALESTQLPAAPLLSITKRQSAQMSNENVQVKPLQKGLPMYQSRERGLNMNTAPVLAQPKSQSVQNSREGVNVDLQKHISFNQKRQSGQQSKDSLLSAAPLLPVQKTKSVNNSKEEVDKSEPQNLLVPDQKRQSAQQSKDRDLDSTVLPLEKRESIQSGSSHSINTNELPAAPVLPLEKRASIQQVKLSKENLTITLTKRQSIDQSSVQESEIQAEHTQSDTTGTTDASPVFEHNPTKSPNIVVSVTSSAPNELVIIPEISSADISETSSINRESTVSEQPPRMMYSTNLDVPSRSNTRRPSTELATLPHSKKLSNEQVQVKREPSGEIPTDILPHSRRPSVEPQTILLTHSRKTSVDLQAPVLAHSRKPSAETQAPVLSSSRRPSVEPQTNLLAHSRKPSADIPPAKAHSRMTSTEIQVPLQDTNIRQCTDSSMTIAAGSKESLEVKAIAASDNPFKSSTNDPLPAAAAYVRQHSIPTESDSSDTSKINISHHAPKLPPGKIGSKVVITPQSSMDNIKSSTNELSNPAEVKTLPAAPIMLKKQPVAPGLVRENSVKSEAKITLSKNVSSGEVKQAPVLLKKNTVAGESENRNSQMPAAPMLGKVQLGNIKLPAPVLNPTQADAPKTPVGDQIKKGSSFTTSMDNVAPELPKKVVVPSTLAGDKAPVLNIKKSNTTVSSMDSTLAPKLPDAPKLAPKLPNQAPTLAPKLAPKLVPKESTNDTVDSKK
ncbi:hypothetical protein HDV01_004253 [Terramyces sp. JEL0728]|nr:hypothetical protein HDV01_004253 [Terramyces sp. JEL0728]